MYIWFCNRFVDSARKHGVWSKFDKVTDRWADLSVSEVEAMIRNDRIGPYFVRKGAGGSIRIVGKVRSIEFVTMDGDRQSEPVAVFLTAVHRNSARCSSFYKDPADWGARNLEPTLMAEIDDIQEWLAESHAAGNTQGCRLPDPLPEDWIPWLDAPRFEQQAGIVFESFLWVERFQRSEILDFWQNYHELVEGLMTGDVASTAIPGHHGAHRYEGKRATIIAVKKEGLSGKEDLYLLVSPYLGRPSEEQIAKDLDTIEAEPDQDAVHQDSTSSRHLDRYAALSARCYPTYLVLDPQAWLAIERDDEANLALSTEEQGILDGVARVGEPQTHCPLPLFLNGQAGSGKSTMLMRVFADYCDRWLNEDVPGTPLFLTYSPKLLETARKGVLSILNSHADYIVADEPRESIEADAIEPCFQPFGKFLQELAAEHTVESYDSLEDLGPEPRSDCLHGLVPRGDTTASYRCFPAEAEITFHRFRRLYHGTGLDPDIEPYCLQLPQRRRYSAETAWYTIRNFIKGSSTAGYLTPDQYARLPREDQTIPSAVFDDIHGTIWNSWYRLLPGKGARWNWDDQDLVRHVITSTGDLPTFPVIFCDESQDFTRLDIKLILELSKMANHDLSGLRPHTIPFMFAGDPLQTLNPTGFRWDSLRSAFYAEIHRAIDPLHRFDVTMSFRGLERNYRSSAEVVRFLNLLQVWRKQLFAIPGLKPQLSWSRGPKVEPRKYVIGDNISAADLRGRLDDVPIIVPTEEGGETEFVQNDPILSQQLTADAKGGYRNVFTAMGAKGLEFDKVILFGFGDVAVPRWWTVAQGDSDARPLEEEHFFNKLYVAASRAKRYLIILDAPGGNESLWARLAGEDGIAQATTGQIGEPWKQHVRGLSSGTRKTVSEINETNPLKVADEIQKAGMRDEDDSLMRKAAGYYRAAGRTDEARTCDAWEARFSERWSAASDIFVKLGMEAEAGDCLWDGQLWQKLHRWYQAPGRDGQDGERALLASFLRHDELASGHLPNLAKRVDNWIERHRSLSAGSTQWRALLEVWIETVSRLADDQDSLSSRQWKDQGLVLSRLLAEGFSDAGAAAARCFFMARNYAAAAKAWESIEQTDHREYYLAKAELTVPPDSLRWLALAGEEDRVLKAWESVKSDDPRWLTHVVPILERRRRALEAVRGRIALQDWQNALALLPQVRRLSFVERAKALGLLLPCAFRENAWNTALDIHRELASLPIPNEAKNQARYAIVQALVRQQAWDQSHTQSVEERLSTFVERSVVGRPTWRSYLPVAIVGAALERMSIKRMTPVKFYEGLAKEPANRDEFRFARGRWLRCKQRLVEFEETRQNAGKASKHRNELRKAEDEWGIYWESVPEYPEPAITRPDPLPIQEEAAAPPGPLQQAGLEDIAGYTVLRPSAGLLVLVDNESGSTLTIDGARMQIKGEGLKVSKSDNGAVVFSSDAIPVAGTLSRLDGRPFLEIEIDGDRRSVFLAD